MNTIAAKGQRLRELNRSVIPEQQDEVERLRSIATSQPVSYDKAGSSGINADNSAERKNVSYINAVEELNRLIAERDRIVLELPVLIDSVFKSSLKRRIAKLYFIDGLSGKEIADKVHCSVGTVWNYVNFFKKYEK